MILDSVHKTRMLISIHDFFGGGKRKLKAQLMSFIWIDGETVETVSDFNFWAPKSLQMMIAAMKLKKTLTPWKGSYDQPREHIQKQRHYFAD